MTTVAPTSTSTSTTTTTTTTTVPVVTTTTTVPAPTPVSTSKIATDADVAAWQMTATCETSGDWSMQGSMYSGGLGMLNQTWVAYGGLEFAPNAGLATPQQQVTVAMRIQPNPPDVTGCVGPW